MGNCGASHCCQRTAASPHTGDRKNMDEHATTWLNVRNTNVDPAGTPLGVGELEAITLAEQLYADLLLMDDLDGRIEA
jgi:predicted nucleic acid-binding protein